MVLDLGDVGFREVDAAAGALHDVARGHDRPWHGDVAAVDDISEEQFVGGEVLLAAGVVPDVCVAVLVVGLVRRVRPGAYALFGRRAVPFAVPRGEGEVVEGGDCHVVSFPVAGAGAVTGNSRRLGPEAHESLSPLAG